MANGDVLLAALIERFSDRGLRLGTPPDPVAVFPAKHPDVGDVRVRGGGTDVTVAVGQIIEDQFRNIDSHLEEGGPNGLEGEERDLARRLAADYERVANR
jgi:hypothetical protein